MIPTLMLWLFRKYCISRTGRLVKKKKTVKKAMFFVICCLGASNLFASPNTFQISFKGKPIGKMVFTENRDGEKLFLKFHTQVETRFVFNLQVRSEDQSYFKDGRLQLSKIERQINNNKKDTKITRFISPTQYEVSYREEKSQLDHAITYNLMLLYVSEPIDEKWVYADNFQCLLEIKKLSNSRYQVNLPDGNYNIYTFKEGRCVEVEHHQTFYTIHMKLMS
ncbi:DUF6134 family protein [Pseudopedobacter beijingensis]|uniref:DUF6134 family protein n=1 Tax=Pseudopedobacter beijingensis TaxID=1207056 RepID=A0ABW4IHJ6_9SPHI